MTLAETMFCLIRNEITGEALPDNIEYDLEKLIGLSKSHDLAHLIADALIRNAVIDTTYSDYKNIKQEKLRAIYREVQRTYTYEKIINAFSSDKIEFVPLKGILIRDLYPEPWMRSSCDIDILVHENDIERAKNSLINEGFTTDNRINYHDIHFYLDNVHLELHHNICENNEQLDRLLSKVWDNIEPVSGVEYRENKEFFAFHHVAHMAYHFLAGGCGIRPFIDLWLMRQKQFYDDNGLIALLNECELVPFYDAVCDLIDVWFGNKEHTELTQAMNDYVISGGVYGNKKNSETIGIAQNNESKAKYLFTLAFLPYENMCVLYPSLRKHKILLPFCYIHRIFYKLFGKDKKRVRNRIQNIKQRDADDVKGKAGLLKELNLK
ncbi:MAG: nucleotidyltransferase family protein [Clostridia bacterium]|nr:nucleotidyltransferase family protein [Clostridia bacterium]